jgi:hypothetical protein
MTNRRYTDQEVAEIFERASQVQRAGLRKDPAEGMTLSQLQEIAREVGIAPEAVAEAARSVDLTDRRTIRRMLGLPVGVGLTADLGRRLTDEEWQQLVVDLRETFDARGSVREEGAFRQWTNGNLQVHIEPTPTGNQVRMRTLKEDARVLITVGLVLIGLAAFALPAKVLAGADMSNTLARILPLAFIGAGISVVAAIQVPRWARKRQAQMASILARLRSG